MRRTQWIAIALSAAAFVLGLVSNLAPTPSWIIGGVCILLFALPAFTGVILEKKVRGILLIFGIGIFAYIVESIALRYGFPYGYFFYANQMGPSPFGLAPLLTPFAFAPLALGVFALATRLKLKDLQWIFGSGLMLVAIDLLIDPAAIAQGLWNYRNGGFLHGMPLSNILGWLFSGSLLSFICRERLRSSLPLYGLLFILAFWTAVAGAHLLIIPGIFGVVLFGFTAKLLFTRI